MRYTIQDKIEAVRLVEGGMSYCEAERRCGASRESIRRWHRSMRSGEWSALIDARPRHKEPPMDLANLPDDPEELKRIIFDLQFELDLKEAVVDIVKKDPGVDPRRLPNRQKALLVDAMVKGKKPYSIGWMTSSLHLAPATFYYHRKRIGKDPEAALKARVRAECARRPAWGYRRIKAALEHDEKDPLRVSEKRVRRIMKAEGLSVARRRKTSRYSSYRPEKDTSRLPNIPLRQDGSHNFTSSVPNRLWLSDVTEFSLPAGRVFLSPVLDCFDGALVSWKCSTSEKGADLTDPSLQAACERLTPLDRCVIHTDRGGHYHSDKWKAICRDNRLARSMSRKGHSPDNARMEGFFGRLKMEFFDTGNWEGVTASEFMRKLDEWLVYYNEDRPKASLGWMSPMQYRRSKGYAA